MSLKRRNIFIAIVLLSFVIAAISISNYSNCKGNCENGFGTYTYPNGDIYEGQWRNGKRDGSGKMTYTDGSYRNGIWISNRFVEGEEALVIGKKVFNDTNINYKAHNLEWWNIILGIIASSLGIVASILGIQQYKENKKIKEETENDFV